MCIEFEKQTTAFAELIDLYLHQYTENINQPVLREAMEYSLFAGGKRIRPLLLISASGDNLAASLPFACAIECIHTYSLIHDDLPCMDNDDFRRGKPSSHKKFGEAVALLAGDALLNLAYEIMGQALCKARQADVVNLKNAMLAIASAAGAEGMVGGQTDDIMFTEGDKVPDESEIVSMYARKTGALIVASIVAGAYIGKIPMRDGKIERAAKMLGEAFQIKDDILDVTSTTETLGKPVGSDAKNNKNTFVSILGIEAAQKRFETLSFESTLLIRETYGQSSLLHLAEKMMNRNH
ncbi:MAG: polyprenyl synthetase family protein [Clostridiales bacterium]|jgi:geranylgeranyl diphosphate synthase type II|nr:polyprenyl synthetase family protein [Clostridiales bacterium]